MPFTRADRGLVSRAATGLRMVIESLASAFATPDDDASVFESVRMATGAMLDGGWPMGQDAMIALSSLAPVVVLSSAARTTTTDSADQTNVVARGAVVVLNLTAFVTAASLTLKVQRKNASGSYTDIATAAAALTANGKAIVVLDPLASDNTVEFSRVQNGALPREWRVEVVHGNANSHTYSVAVYPIR